MCVCVCVCVCVCARTLCTHAHTCARLMNEIVVGWESMKDEERVIWVLEESCRDQARSKQFPGGPAKMDENLQVNKYNQYITLRVMY